MESCVTKEIAISPWFSPTIFDPDANSVLLRAYLCTAVDSMRRKPCVRNCSREREDLYNGNVQQNRLCAASCAAKDIPISPRFPPTFFHRRANPAPYSAQFLIHSSPSLCTLQFRSSLLSQYVFSSHSFWTSSSLDVPAGVTQEEGHTGFLYTFFLRCAP